MSSPLGLSKQRLQELRLIWRDFCHRYNTQKLDFTQFRLLLRSIGVDLIADDIRALRDEWTERGDFSFEDLCHASAGTNSDEALQERLVDALGALDPKQTGRLDIGELRTTLYKIGLGVRLSLPEIDAFLSLLPQNNGSVAIDDFILRLLAD